MGINRWKAIVTDREEDQRISLGLQKAVELLKKKVESIETNDYTNQNNCRQSIKTRSPIFLHTVMYLRNFPKVIA
ncbi:hypothetical protein TNCV_2241841 [Trichonephila clavipes]|nr:hypothetical protein TNCV_2241841 [Trichonephila clavipes]